MSFHTRFYYGMFETAEMFPDWIEGFDVDSQLVGCRFCCSLRANGYILCMNYCQMLQKATHLWPPLIVVHVCVGSNAVAS